MLFKQRLMSAVWLALGAMSTVAAAQDPLVPAGGAPMVSPDAGFYGGVVLRQGTQEGSGIQLGNKFASAWGKFVAPTADETVSSSRTLFFGGYRWANDIALEAAIATADRYALAPYGRGGVGLALAAPPDNAAARTWNADVYTSWSVRSSLALYGRLGYVSDATLASGPASFQVGDPRRARDGVNYGFGLRYDVTRALGLRLEYARFGRFAGEGVSGALPESDQVQFGMQYRF